MKDVIIVIVVALGIWLLIDFLQYTFTIEQLEGYISLIYNMIKTWGTQLI